MTNKINGIDVNESVSSATNNDVYYSQKAVDELQNKIKRLQEENEELRKVRKNFPDIQMPYIYLYRQIKKQCHKLEQENEKLKEKIKDLDAMTGIFSVRLANKYKQALEEIRKIAEDAYNNDQEYQATGVYNEILDKINEALNDRD